MGELKFGHVVHCAYEEGKHEAMKGTNAGRGEMEKIRG